MFCWFVCALFLCVFVFLLVLGPARPDFALLLGGWLDGWRFVELFSCFVCFMCVLVGLLFFCSLLFSC